MASPRQDAVLEAEARLIIHYIPDEEDREFSVSRAFMEKANQDQLTYSQKHATWAN